LARNDTSKALEVNREDSRRLERRDGYRDELSVFEMGFDGF